MLCQASASYYLLPLRREHPANTHPTQTELISRPYSSNPERRNPESRTDLHSAMPSPLHDFYMCKYTTLKKTVSPASVLCQASASNLRHDMTSPHATTKKKNQAKPHPAQPELIWRPNPPNSERRNQARRFYLHSALPPSLPMPTGPIYRHRENNSSVHCAVTGICILFASYCTSATPYL